MTEAGMVIQAQGLVKRYGALEAVRGIDLGVRAGEIFGFLGPNGAGKSTTISILCTLLTPTAGTARVAGIDVMHDPAGVRQRIGLVFQDPSLDDQLTGRENLEFHAFIYSVPASVRRQRIDEMLSLLQLTDRAGSQVRTYSGGMKRRLEIARGMLHQPQILFLDEPTLGLDPQTRQSIWAHLNALRGAKGITIFMTTHYMDEAEYCDRIAIIDRGHIVALGTPDELKAMVGGDVVTMTSSRPDEAATEIREVLGVTPFRENGTLRMEVPDGKAFVPRLVRELVAPVDTVSLRRPSLDDVFLKLTGHAIRDEEAGTKDQMRAMASRWMGRRR
ncbi:ATP-binding cassette domain-containing protein [bacterium]|nr:MAG: ATP-binding cassette domain-containing protein [bacterium]